MLCSEKRTVFWGRSSRKTLSFVRFVFLQIFFATRAFLHIGKYSWMSPQVWLGNIRPRDALRPIIAPERNHLMDHKVRYTKAFSVFSWAWYENVICQCKFSVTLSFNIFYHTWIVCTFESSIVDPSAWLCTKKKQKQRKCYRLCGGRVRVLDSIQLFRLESEYKNDCGENPLNISLPCC